MRVVVLLNQRAVTFSLLEGCQVLTLEVLDEGKLNGLLIADCELNTGDLDQAGLSLIQLSTHAATLDDVFLTLTGRTLRD